MNVLPLVPLPARTTPRDADPFTIGSDIRLTGEADAVEHLRGILSTLGAPSGPHNESDSAPAHAIELRIAGAGPAESYTLDVDADRVRVDGADAAGLFYGVQTLGQLITRDSQVDSAAGSPRWIIPAVRIEDAPRFAYRGVMLDVARHFHGVDTVLAYIDRASSLKFNVLHLHLTDDQGWRLHIASRPLLTERASDTAVGGDTGGFYTHDDYRRIVTYAASRHMVVVPEIDVPGHTHAVSLAYPDVTAPPVISDHIREIVRDYGGELPASGTPYDGMAVGFSSLQIDNEATYDLLQDVFADVAALTPGPYLHIGGDEALGTDPSDFARFMARVTEMVAGLGKTPIAWHEAGAAPGLAPTTIGQYWGFVSPIDGADEKARAFVAHGARVIFSPADAIYLDMKFDADSPLGLTWARGVTSLQRAYEWDAAAIVDGITDPDILGIEAPLWTETVPDLTAIDALAFPRIAAAAEAGWSPQFGSSDDRSWESFRARLGRLAPLWRAQGIGFTPLGEIDWSAD